MAAPATKAHVIYSTIEGKERHVNENTKFFVGMAVSMLVPVIIFSYGQGQVSQAIDELSKQTVSLNSKVDGMSSDLSSATSQLAVNTSNIDRVDNDLGAMRREMAETNSRVSVLEFARGVSK